MRPVKVGAVQLLLAATLVLIHASSVLALDLPDAHLLSGEEYPTEAEGEVLGAGVGKLETTGGEKLTFSDMLLDLVLRELSSLGSMAMVFSGVTEAFTKTNCNTAGDPSGFVSIPGEYHIVDIETAPLVAAVLLLYKETIIECNSGKLKVKLRAPIILKLAKVTSGTDVTQVGIVAKCHAVGEQEPKEYFNDAGALVLADPTAHFGLGFELACLSLTKELVLTTGKMVNFLF
jgi:hypothetical protein